MPTALIRHETKYPIASRTRGLGALAQAFTPFFEQMTDARGPSRVDLEAWGPGTGLVRHLQEGTAITDLPPEECSESVGDLLGVLDRAGWSVSPDVAPRAQWRGTSIAHADAAALMARIEQRGHRARVTLGYQFLLRRADGAALPWPEPDVPSGGIHSSSSVLIFLEHDAPGRAYVTLHFPWDQPCDELRTVWAEVRRLCPVPVRDANLRRLSIGSRGQYRTQRIVLTPA